MEGLAVQDKALAAFLHKRVKKVRGGKTIDVRDGNGKRCLPNSIGNSESLPSHGYLWLARLPKLAKPVKLLKPIPEIIRAVEACALLPASCSSVYQKCSI